MRASIVWSLGLVVRGVLSLHSGQKRGTDTPAKNVNAATNRYIVEVERVRFRDTWTSIAFIDSGDYRAALVI
jgi:hypothetical protein